VPSTPKTSHLHAVKRILRYLKGKPKLGLWSTIESYFVLAANCYGQVLWIQNQMLDYGFNFMNTRIYIDNESTICIVKNPIFHSKTKHIEIRHHFIRDAYEKKLIQVLKIHTDDNVADLLTKAFDVSRHQELASPEQTSSGKEFSNPLIVDSLLKTIWLSMHHVIAMKHWLFQGKRQLVKNHQEGTATLCTIEDGVLGISTTIDRKVKVLVSEASIRRHLKLEDSEGLSSLPNAEMFEQLANMGITSSPSLSPQTHQSSPSPHSIDTTHHIEEPTKMPHESTLHSVHSLGRDEGSLSLNELTVLCTSLSKKVASLESELKPIKETYSTALTKLILRVKKLEKQVQTTNSKRKPKIVLSEDEDAAKDPSNQGRIIEEIDADTYIILVTPTKVSSQSDQSKDHLRVLSTTKVLAEAAKQGRSVGLTQTYTRRRRNVGTGSGGVSNASESESTAGGKAKDKGKEIMQEPEPPKKLKKKVQVQMSMDEKIAKKMFEDEQAKVMTEQEQERMNLEAALELQMTLVAREEVPAEAT
ncbi:hypothetical protein Tco_0902982, partial [Tanacetum coccineum]